MEVSSFELIYKPQSPSGAADIVLQGYFLNITNLEDVPLRFRVDFVTGSVSTANRSLAGNTFCVYDLPNNNNQSASLIGGATAPSFRFSPNITIGPDETAKIVVLPLNPFSMPAGPADFEARGHVTLRLPARFVLNNGIFILQPQLDRPARVLLTPQNRATYLDSAGNINDQTQSSLPTASGAALSEVEAESGFFPLPLGNLASKFRSLNADDLSDIEEADMAKMLTALASGAVDFKDLNAELKKAGLGMALEKRKV